MPDLYELIFLVVVPLMYSSTHTTDASSETIVLLRCVAEDLLCWCFLNDLSFRMKVILLGLGSA